MSCSHCGGCGGRSDLGPLSETELLLMDELACHAFLPICRLLLRSPEDEELSFVMSAPVYLPHQTTDIEDVRRYGTALLNLRKRGYVTLDYGMPISGFDYEVWKESAYYQRFAFSVEAPGAEPMLEAGSAALTLQGQEALG